MRDFQFYDEARIEQLIDQEMKFYQKYQYSVEPPALSGLTEGEVIELERLIGEGYDNISHNTFRSFIKANEIYGRNNIDKISHHVKGKTVEEVCFFLFFLGFEAGDYSGGIDGCGDGDTDGVDGIDGIDERRQIKPSLHPLHPFPPPLYGRCVSTTPPSGPTRYDFNRTLHSRLSFAAITLFIHCTHNIFTLPLRCFNRRL
jgi:hypothetical protein